jgi:hypothetical protein
LTSSCKNLNDLDKKNIEEIIAETQKINNQNELSDKERYLLSHKIDSLKEIN